MGRTNRAGTRYPEGAARLRAGARRGGAGAGRDDYGRYCVYVLSSVSLKAPGPRLHRRQLDREECETYALYRVHEIGKTKALAPGRRGAGRLPMRRVSVRRSRTARVPKECACTCTTCMQHAHTHCACACACKCDVSAERHGTRWRWSRTRATVCSGRSLPRFHGGNGPPLSPSGRLLTSK